LLASDLSVVRSAHHFRILVKVYDGDDDVWCVVGTRYVEDTVGEAMDECAPDWHINYGKQQRRLSEIVSSNSSRKSKPRAGL
jgi:hypothetical protein